MSIFFLWFEEGIDFYSELKVQINKFFEKETKTQKQKRQLSIAFFSLPRLNPKL